VPAPTPIPFGVSDARARLVVDAEFGPVLGTIVRAARQAVLCSYFIVDVSPYRGPAYLVDELLGELESALWRGVDVRILLGGSRDNPDILETCMGAGLRLRQRGIPFRLITARAVEQTSHAKFTVADDVALVGSHNVSGNSLTCETQDSVAVQSAALAAYLRGEFERQWIAASLERP
jgi:phosphatidylserine/phosphatidylglycerophosphate/cardiolipin synthase-like enzyme